MNKGLAITGGVLLFVSILVNVISIVSVADYRPTNENILHDTSKDGTTFEYDGDAITMEVYAKSDTANCFNYEISVTDSMNQDVFISNCDGTDFPSYTYLGDLADISAGTYTIASEGDIVIVDASEIVAPAIGLCGGSVCCLLGLILLIVGLVSGRKHHRLSFFNNQVVKSISRIKPRSSNTFLLQCLFRILNLNPQLSNKKPRKRECRCINPTLMDFRLNIRKTNEGQYDHQSISGCHLNRCWN